MTAPDLVLLAVTRSSGSEAGALAGLVGEAMLLGLGEGEELLLEFLVRRVEALPEEPKFPHLAPGRLPATQPLVRILLHLYKY